ncbi:Uncharacterised protein [Mycobacterium tuberculosis]|nr:Uncharacterised protein [Mycobacterium tuberculosis]
MSAACSGADQSTSLVQVSAAYCGLLTHHGPGLSRISPT